VLEWDPDETADNFWNWLFESQIDNEFVNMNPEFGFLRLLFSWLKAGHN
jgi:hypothetical protein